MTAPDASPPLFKSGDTCSCCGQAWEEGRWFHRIGPTNAMCNPCIVHQTRGF